MRTSLRAVAALVAAGVIAFWFFGGPNLGFSKSYVEHKVKDPVTELDQIVKEDRFIPGVDFLAAGLFCSLALAGISFLFKSKTNSAAN